LATFSPLTTNYQCPGTVASNRFGGGRDRVRLTKVEPNVVAEVTADFAQQGDVVRHPCGSSGIDHTSHSTTCRRLPEQQVT